MVRTYIKKLPPVVISVWDYTKVMLGALLLASAVRAVWFEPFKIPSASMVPTLLVGDYIFVNKYAYGWRNPCTGQRYGGEDTPIQRGDVVVFAREKPWVCGMALGFGGLNFIKRAVAVPGDTVAYKDKILYINGQPLGLSEAGTYTFTDGQGASFTARRLKETTPEGLQHDILLMDDRPGMDMPPVTVPEGFYVMMGDDRDNSFDARMWEYPKWSFVRKEDVVGRASVIFMSWEGFLKPRAERIGMKLQMRDIQSTSGAAVSKDIQ